MTGQPIDLTEWLDRLGFDENERYQIGNKAPGGMFNAYTVPVDAGHVGVPLDRDVWVGPNPTEHVTTGRPTADQVTRLAALHIDLDVKATGCPSFDVAWAIIDDLSGMLGTRPVAVTMSGHGLQPVWAVEYARILGATERSVARALLRRWGRLVAAVAEKRAAKVDSLYDLTRILRCPGSVNWKDGAHPVKVECWADTGAPLDVERILETLDEFNVPAMQDDTRDPGAIISAPAEWTFAPATCGYAARMGAQWATETPDARHPWLVRHAVRVAAAHRNGCVDETGRNLLAAQLVARFHQLLQRDGREPGPGEIADAFGWGVQATAAMTDNALASELGYHLHADQQASQLPKGMQEQWENTAHTGAPGDLPGNADDARSVRGEATAATVDQPGIPAGVAGIAERTEPEATTPEGHSSTEHAHSDHGADAALTPAEQAANDLRRLAVEAKANELRVLAEARALFAEQTGPRPADLAREYLDVTELGELPEQEPLISNTLMRHCYIILRGRDGTYKSFVAIDWSLSLATGRPWQGMDTERVKVLYVAGEGAYGVADRVAAWETAWRRKVEPQWFTLRRSAVNLFTGGPALDDLIERVERDGYGFVVIDTLRRASGRADANSSDMGVIVDNIDRIKQATHDGSVLVITHTDKSDGDTRGYSGIEDDADIVWHSKRDDDNNGGFDLCNAKMKDGEDNHELTLRTRRIDLPAGRDGKPRSSLVIEARNEDVFDQEHETDRKVIATLAATFATTGATVNELVAVTELPQSTIYKVRGRLELAGKVELVRSGSGSRIHLTRETLRHARDQGLRNTPENRSTGGVESEARFHADSTPSLMADSTAV